MSNGLHGLDIIIIIFLFFLSWVFNYMHTQEIVEAVAEHNKNSHIVVHQYHEGKPEGKPEDKPEGKPEDKP